MEQPRYREAAAAEGGDGPGWSRDPPGNGGGDSAAWNGTCGLEDAADLPFPGPGCSCRYRGEPAAPPSPAAERRDGSCSLTCHHRATAAAPVPPLPGEEDGAGEEGAGKGNRRTRRRQRHRSAKEESGRREGKRQRPVRKRSRGDGSELPGPVEELAGCRGLLARGLVAQALAQARRLAAEAGGWLLCSCCRLGAGDLGWAQAGVRSWGRRVGQRARSGCLRAARWLRAGAELFLRLLWMLFALLLLLLMLLLGSLRLCWRVGAAALAAGAHRLGRSRRVAWLLALLDAAVLRRTWGLLGENRTCRYLWDWLQRRRAPPWAAGGGRTGGPGAGEAPAGSGEEVSRLLAMAEVPEEELNPFQVLGVEVTASDAELKKAYRRLAVLVRAGGGSGWWWGSPPSPRDAALRFPAPPRSTRTRTSTRGRRRRSRCCGRRGTSSAAPRGGRSTRCEWAMPGDGGGFGDPPAQGLSTVSPHSPQQADGGERADEVHERVPEPAAG